jgi:hypothetical protein
MMSSLECEQQNLASTFDQISKLAMFLFILQTCFQIMLFEISIHKTSYVKFDFYKQKYFLR